MVIIMVIMKVVIIVTLIIHIFWIEDVEDGNTYRESSILTNMLTFL